MAGLPTFFSSVEGYNKAAPYHHTYLFILFVEVLASAVRNNDRMNGICISETEC